MNIAPQPDGRLPRRGIETLRELGEFMKRNGEAVYGTRECAPYFNDGFAFTRKENTVYAFYLYEEDSAVRNTFTLPYFGRVSKVSLLSDDLEVATKVEDGNNIEIEVLSRTSKPVPYADVFRIDLEPNE